MQEAGKIGLFPKTRWTLVGRAADRSPAASEQALSELIERYMPALRVHLTGARRISRDCADDLLQSFVADKILMGNLLARASQERGKFRTFLLTALDRYTISAFRKEQAERRSPGQGCLVPLDSISELTENSTRILPYSALFDLAWTQEVIGETLRRVQSACETSGKAPHWALFEDRIVNPILHGQPAEPYAEIVSRLNFSTPMQASNALTTVKRMFQRILRTVVQEYAGDELGVDQEIAELRAILAEISAYP